MPSCPTLVALYETYRQAERDAAEARELADDPAMKAYADEEAKKARAAMERLEAELQKALLPKDPNDERNLFLEVRAGTGGDESALFAGDLFRMYTRYAERQGWQVEIISESPSELGGYKEVIARIVGHGAYSRLKFESGGHRVQRVPETETQGRIHTSACTVAVLPEADAINDVVLNPAELRIDTFRASGAGGQHVNKTDSAIRVTHLPTGIVVECQDARSQHKNREQALGVLAARIRDKQSPSSRRRPPRRARRLIGSGDRSERIRTYNFPQGRVTDHRINLTLYKIERIMDGELDEMIDALAAEHQAEQLASLPKKPLDRRGRRLRSSGIDAREARLLLAAATGFSEASVLAHPERAAACSRSRTSFSEMTRAPRRRRAGRLHPRPQGVLRPAISRSTPAVLIPRPETELLVDLALGAQARLACSTSAPARARSRSRSSASGPRRAWSPTDASAAALEVARSAMPCASACDIELRHGRWFEPLAGERFEADRLQSALRRGGRPAPRRPALRAARRARVGGADGLDAIRAIAARGARAPDPRRLAAARAWRGPGTRRCARCSRRRA